jgi:hypothetical protein
MFGLEESFADPQSESARAWARSVDTAGERSLPPPHAAATPTRSATEGSVPRITGRFARAVRCRGDYPAGNPLDAPEVDAA